MVANLNNISPALEYETGIVYLVNKMMLDKYHTVAHEGGTRTQWKNLQHGFIFY